MMMMMMTMTVCQLMYHHLIINIVSQMLTILMNMTQTDNL